MILPDPPTPASPAVRLVRASGLALAFVLAAFALLGPAGAPARGATARRSACQAPARHARHVKGARCTRRAAAHHSKPAQGAHRPAKHPTALKHGSHPLGAGVAATPALCEDGSEPLRGLSGYTCSDGSEPGCEDGSEPLAARGGAPQCLPAVEAPVASGEGSEGEGGETSCETALAAGEAPLGCEAAGGGEALS